MTHPNREELAGRLDKAAALADEIGRETSASLFAEAAALRQPVPGVTVEEAAGIIDPEAMNADLFGEPKIVIRRTTARRMAALAKAQAIMDRLDRGER